MTIKFVTSCGVCNACEEIVSTEDFKNHRDHCDGAELIDPDKFSVNHLIALMIFNMQRTREGVEEVNANLSVMLKEQEWTDLAEEEEEGVDVR